MKTATLWLLPFISLASLTAGINHISISPDLLVPNEPNGTEVSFKGGSTKVRISSGDFFKMQGFGDRVEFQSVSTKDWYFDNKVIYPWELPLTSLSSIEDSDILTITATARHNASEQFKVNVIKYMDRGRMTLRVISVSVIPEPAHAVLLLGFVALLFIMIKHRKQNT